MLCLLLAGCGSEQWPQGWQRVNVLFASAQQEPSLPGELVAALEAVPGRRNVVIVPADAAAIGRLTLSAEPEMVVLDEPIWTADCDASLAAVAAGRKRWSVVGASIIAAHFANAKTRPCALRIAAALDVVFVHSYTWDGKAQGIPAEIGADAQREIPASYRGPDEDRARAYALDSIPEKRRGIVLQAFALRSDPTPAATLRRHWAAQSAIARERGVAYVAQFGWQMDDEGKRREPGLMPGDSMPELREALVQAMLPH